MLGHMSRVRGAQQVSLVNYLFECDTKWTLFAVNSGINVSLGIYYLLYLDTREARH